MQKLNNDRKQMNISMFYIYVLLFFNIFKKNKNKRVFSMMVVVALVTIAIYPVQI